MAKFFINRPIVAIVIAIIMTIVGAAAMLGLPTAQFPNIVPPEIQITTTFSAGLPVGLVPGSAQAQQVQALLAYMTSPQAAEAKRRQGMEPA